MQYGSSTSLRPNGGNNKVEEAKYNLVRILVNKFGDNVLILTRKDKGRDRWDVVLVDWGKKNKFLDISDTGGLEKVACFGKFLDSGFGDVPSYSEILNKFYDSLFNFFFIIELKTEECVKTYYVKSDEGKEHEIMTASSVEEIRRCGRILLSLRDEHPPESLAHVIEEEYFGLAKYNTINDSKPFDAAQKGKLQNVAKYLEEGGDVNSTDEYGWSLLHHAAHCGNIELLEFLKSKDANVHTQEKMCGRKPVHIAAKEGHPNAISFFLRNGAIVNEQDKNNWTLLHYAVWRGDLNTVRFLVQQGADIHAAETSVGKKPIHVAAEYNHTDVVEFLLENNAQIEDCDETGRTPLYYSTWTGHLETSKFLINNGANITVKTIHEKTLLHAAALVNNKENITFFLDAGLNIDEKDINGLTPLLYAAQNGNFDVVQIFVDSGANFYVINNYYKHLDFIGERYVNILVYLTDKMAKKFQKQGEYNDGKIIWLYKRAIEIVKEKFGHDHLETLKTQNKVGMMLYQLGRYDEAGTFIKDVLDKREIFSNPNHLDILCAKHSMGLVYDAQAKYSEAMEILKDVFDKRITILGAYHDDTLNVSRDLGNVYFKKGEYEEAFEIFQDVFKKRNRNFGTDHPKTLQAWQDMAIVLVNKGDYKMALQILKDILEKRKITLGNNHPDTIFTLHHLTLISQKYENELKEKSSCSIQ